MTCRSSAIRPKRAIPELFRLACAALWLGLLSLLPGLSGCAAFKPLDGVPARYLPDELRGRSRENGQMIDLSLLRRRSDPEYRIDSGDVLAVYVEGVLGQREQPPINQVLTGQPLNRFPAPTLGYPLTVRDDGTLSLPLIPPVTVRGRTIPQIEQELRYHYTVTRRLLQPGLDRILVALHQPRQYRVLVVRQENQTDLLTGINTSNGSIGRTKRGTGHVVALPAYRNDVLHALVESGGLPGLDAENTVYVIRASQGPAAPIPPASLVPGHSGFAHPGGAGPITPVPPARGVAPGGYPLIRGQSPDPAGFMIHQPTAYPPGWSPPVTWNQVDQLTTGTMLQSPHVVRIPLRLENHEPLNLTEEDVTLRDGDIIFIGSRDDEVYYTGGLLGGGEFTLPRDRDIDVLEAIAIAESRTQTQQSGRTALNSDVTISPSQAIVLRTLPNGTQVPILVDLYRARTQSTERILIQPGDYIILQFTRSEAIAAFIERHILATALFGVAAAQLDGGI